MYVHLSLRLCSCLVSGHRPRVLWPRIRTAQGHGPDGTESRTEESGRTASARFTSLTSMCPEVYLSVLRAHTGSVAV